MQANEEKIIRTMNVFNYDIKSNKRHIDRLENGDDYLKISE
jgi:hypothetical protein